MYVFNGTARHLFLVQYQNILQETGFMALFLFLAFDHQRLSQASYKAGIEYSCHTEKPAVFDFLLFSCYRPHGSSKAGDNALGSIHLSVSPFVCLFVDMFVGARSTITVQGICLCNLCVCNQGAYAD